MKELNPKIIGNSASRKGAAIKGNTKINEYIAYLSLLVKERKKAKINANKIIIYFNIYSFVFYIIYIMNTGF